MKTCLIMAAVLLIVDICFVWDIDWNTTKYSDPYWKKAGQPQTLRELVLYFLIVVVTLSLLLIVPAIS